MKRDCQSISIVRYMTELWTVIVCISYCLDNDDSRFVDLVKDAGLVNMF